MTIEQGKWGFENSYLYVRRDLNKKVSKLHLFEGISYIFDLAFNSKTMGN